jgi:hypothetical protein
MAGGQGYLHAVHPHVAGQDDVDEELKRNANAGPDGQLERTERFRELPAVGDGGGTIAAELGNQHFRRHLGALVDLELGECIEGGEAAVPIGVPALGRHTGQVGQVAGHRLARLDSLSLEPRLTSRQYTIPVGEDRGCPGQVRNDLAHGPARAVGRPVPGFRCERLEKRS